MLSFDISSEEFLSEYFEIEPRIFPRAGRAALAQPINIEGALTASDHTDGRINVFLNGQLPFDIFTEGFQDVGAVRRRVSLDKVEKLLNSGATVAINRIDRDSVHVRKICDIVQRFTGEVATANCYAAVSGSGSFGRHWDTHDVFALQMAGRKHWKVWKPTHLLPVSGQASRDYRFTGNESPHIDVVLEEGDAMYIPRGWWHEALPVKGHATIHLAIGIHVSTVADYMAWIAENALSLEPSFRQSLSRVTKDKKKLEGVAASIPRIALDPRNLNTYSELHVKMLNGLRSEFRHINFFPVRGEERPCEF